MSSIATSQVPEVEADRKVVVELGHLALQCRAAISESQRDEGSTGVKQLNQGLLNLDDFY